MEWRSSSGSPDSEVYKMTGAGGLCVPDWLVCSLYQTFSISLMEVLDKAFVFYLFERSKQRLVYFYSRLDSAPKLQRHRASGGQGRDIDSMWDFTFHVYLRELIFVCFMPSSQKGIWISLFTKKMKSTEISVYEYGYYSSELDLKGNTSRNQSH